MVSSASQGVAGGQSLVVGGRCAGGWWFDRRTHGPLWMKAIRMAFRRAMEQVLTNQSRIPAVSAQAVVGGDLDRHGRAIWRAGRADHHFGGSDQL